MSGQNPTDPPQAANPYAAPQYDAAPAVPLGMAPHRGSQVMTFGILSVVFSGVGILICPWIFSVAGIGMGIPAVLMATKDLKLIVGGAMDSRGRGATRAGQITGIIGIVLGVLAILLNIVFISILLLGRPVSF